MNINSLTAELRNLSDQYASLIERRDSKYDNIKQSDRTDAQIFNQVITKKEINIEKDLAEIQTLITTNKEGFSEEDINRLNQIKLKVSDLAKDLLSQTKNEAPLVGDPSIKIHLSPLEEDKTHQDADQISASKLQEQMERERAIMEDAGEDIIPGLTALQTACTLELKRLIKKLMTNDADVNAIGPNGNTAFGLTCKSQSFEILNILLSTNNFDGNAVDQYGNNALHHILNMSEGYYDRRDKDELIYKVMDRISDLNNANKNGQTPLHLACEYGSIEIVNSLIKRGANPNLQDGQGNTPLLIALKESHTDCVRLLQKLNADLGDPHKEVSIGDFQMRIESGELMQIASEDLNEDLSLDEFLNKATQLLESNLDLFTKEVIKELLVIDNNFAFKFLKHEAKSGTLLSNKFNLIPSINYKEIENIKLKFKDKSISHEEQKQHKLQLMRELREFYLNYTFQVQKNLFIQFAESLGGGLKLDRFEKLKFFLDRIFLLYISKEKCKANNSLLQLNLTKDRLKIIGEIKQLFNIFHIRALKTFRSENLGEDSLYLGKGVCFGASLSIAAEKINDKFTTRQIQPDPESRFLQASYQLGNAHKELLKKIQEGQISNAHIVTGSEEYQKDWETFKKQLDGNFKSYVEINESFQKKLGITIEEIKGGNTSIYNFFMELEDKISKLDTAKSSHFILAMEHPRDEGDSHSGHAIYINLAPPYEIQDVNYPNFTLKTDDLVQFKKYLFHYFYAMAPRDYNDIYLYQITQRQNITPLESSNIKPTPLLYSLTNEDLTGPFEKMEIVQKTIYLEKRKQLEDLFSIEPAPLKRSEEKKLLEKQLALEALDQLVLMHLKTQNQEVLDRFLDSNLLSVNTKSFIREAVKNIFPVADSTN